VCLSVTTWYQVPTLQSPLQFLCSRLYPLPNISQHLMTSTIAHCLPPSRVCPPLTACRLTTSTANHSSVCVPGIYPLVGPYRKHHFHLSNGCLLWVPCLGLQQTCHDILTRKPERKNQFVRPSLECEGNMKMGFKERM
jgi:hypothetical protein